MEKIKNRILINSAKSTALMGTLRGYYTETLLDQKELNEIIYKREKLSLKDKKQIKALDKKFRNTQNFIKKELKEFDKYISNVLDKMENSGDTSAQLVDVCTDCFDFYLNKAISVKDNKFTFIKDEPVFMLTIEEYAKKINTSIDTVRSTSKILTDKEGNEFVIY